MFPPSAIETNDECIICRGEFNDRDKYLKCINDHKYHFNCIKQYIVSEKGLSTTNNISNIGVNSNCPYCKSDFIRRSYIYKKID